MNAYINSLIIVMVVCQIAAVIAPDSENAKRYIRTVCAIIVLLTLLSPVKHLIALSEGITEKITSFFTTDVSQSYDENEAGAIGIMQYVTEYYNVDELSAIILTDETDTEITEIQLYIKNCPYARCVVIEAELSELLELPVYVFSE